MLAGADRMLDMGFLPDDLRITATLSAEGDAISLAAARCSWDIVSQDDVKVR